MRIIPETRRVRLRYHCFYYYKTTSKILLPWSLRKRQIDDVMLGINVGILTLKSNYIFVLNLGDRYFFHPMVIDYYNLKNQISPSFTSAWCYQTYCYEYAWWKIFRWILSNKQSVNQPTTKWSWSWRMNMPL